MTLRHNAKPYLLGNSLAIIAVNGLVIMQAIVFDWHYGTVLWAYAIQTCIIFIFSVFASSNKKQQLLMVFFPLFYIIIFSTVTFIDGESQYEVINGFADTQWIGVLSSVALYTIAELRIYLLDRKLEIKNIENKLSLRLIAIHCALFGVFFAFPLLVFMLFKTVAEVLSLFLQKNRKHYLKVI